MSNRPVFLAVGAISSIFVVAALLTSESPQFVAGAESNAERDDALRIEVVDAPRRSDARLAPPIPDTGATPSRPSAYWMLLVDHAGAPVPSASIRVIGREPASSAAILLDGGTHLLRPEEGQEPGALGNAIASGDFALVSAPGFAPRAVQLETGHDGPAQAHRVQLQTGFALEVVVRDAGGQVRPGASVRVSIPESRLASGSAQRESRHVRARRTDARTLRSYASVGGARLLEWIEPTDESGIAQFRDLAIDAPLRIDVRCEDFAHESPAIVQGREGELIRREVTLPGAATLQGQLVDRSGRGIAYRPVWVMPAHSEFSQHYFSRRELPLRRAQTGHDGTFSVGRIPSGSYFVGPAPDETGALAVERLPAVGLRVEVEGPTDQRITIDRDLFLEAVTVDSNGLVVADVNVLAVPLGASGTVAASSLADGGVRLGPVQDGSFRLFASLSGSACGASPVDVRVGEGPALLQLTAGASAVCVAVDERSGDPRNIREVLMTEESGALRVLRFAPGNHGRFELRDLKVGTARISISTWDGAQGSAQFDVAIAGPLGREIVVSTRPAETMEVANACLEQPVEILVRDADARIVAVSSLEPGERRLLIVPSESLSIETQHQGRAPELEQVPAARLRSREFVSDCP